MSIVLPPSPTAENFASAVKELLTPIATKMGGRDGRITSNEAQNGVALNRVTTEESELAAETIRRQIASSGAGRPSINATVEGIGRRALRAGKRATGGDHRISTPDALNRLPPDLRKIFLHLRGQGDVAPAPTGLEVVASLQGATDGLGRWHESGDNGVDTRVLFLAGAASAEDALAQLLREASSGNGGRLQLPQGQDAIDQFRTTATSELEEWRSTFYDGPAPAADDSTAAMAAFAAAVNDSFGPLSEVRVARGNDSESYLLGKVRDGYVAAMVWPYRDG